MNPKWSTILLGEIAVHRGGSINPAKFQDEIFELYSIPAYNLGKPDILPGEAIGSAKKNVQPNDVLLSRIVPHIQRVWVVGNKENMRQIASGEWIIYRSNKFHPPFLRYTLLTKQFHTQFMRTISGVGGSLLRARPDQVAQIEIPLPPLTEQQRITATLDKAGAIRRKRRQAIKLADEFLRSVFLDMFGDPVTNPKGYNSASLGDLVEIISGGTPSKAEKRFWNGMFPWVSPKDMKSITINNSIDKISENVFSETPLKRIPQKSILIVIRGMILAHTIPIAITEKEVAINQDIKALIPKQSIVPQFLLWSLNILHNFLLSKVSTAAHGTKRLDMESLRNIDILLPTIVQQNQFVEIANKFSSVKSGQTLSLEQNKAMFNSLSQRAFRGEL